MSRTSRFVAGQQVWQGQWKSRLGVEALEARLTPIILAPLYVTGFDQGGPPVVIGRNAETGDEAFRFRAYGAEFLGGVRVAMGDVNDDDSADIICAPGPGGILAKGSRDVKIFDGSTRDLLGSLRPYGANYDKGINVAAGDVNGDGVADVIVGPATGSKPVIVFNGIGPGIVQTFPANLFARGGVRVAAADVNGDGQADVITQSGAGKDSRIKVFDGATGQRLEGALDDLNPFGPNVAGGAFVAAGDVNGDGKADLIAATMLGRPRLRVFDGDTGAILAKTAQAEDLGYVGGIRVAAGDLDDDGFAEILTGTGKTLGLSPHVQALDGLSLALVDEFFSDPSGKFRGGTTVASGIIAILIG